MTRIDCKAAADNGLSPDQYIGDFILREGDSILLEVDEEGNDIIILDAESAEFLAHKLLAMVETIHKGLRRGRTQTASSHGQEEAVHKDEPSRR